MLTPLESISGQASECIAPLLERNNIQPRNYVSHLAKVFGLSLSQMRRMLSKDICEWTLGDLNLVFNHFGEEFVCFSRDKSAPKASTTASEFSDASIQMPSRSVGCRVILDGKLTDQAGDHQWVAYQMNGDLLVCEHADAPAETDLLRVNKIELLLQQKPEFSIAICDDNVDLANSLGDFLRDYGFSPSVFYSAPDVEKAMVDTVFDAFVLDWQIGNQTSESLIRLIRLAKSSSAPIFLITGQLNHGLSTESEIANVVRNYRVLARDKPIRPSILAAELMSAIEHANNAKDAAK